MVLSRYRICTIVIDGAVKNLHGLSTSFDIFLVNFFLFCNSVNSVKIFDVRAEILFLTV